MNWTETLEKLRADPTQWAAIARATGLPRMTVARIAKGETPHPRVDTAAKIVDYYERAGALAA